MIVIVLYKHHDLNCFYCLPFLIGNVEKNHTSPKKKEKKKPKILYGSNLEGLDLLS